MMSRTLDFILTYVSIYAGVFVWFYSCIDVRLTRPIDITYLVNGRANDILDTQDCCR